MRVRIEGALDTAALEQALQNTVDCHELLRARFSEDEGGPCIMVSGERRARLTVMDLTDDASPAERWESVVRKELLLPFAMATGPLIRFRLARLGEELHELLVVAHEIIVDRYSLILLQRHIVTAYGAAARRGTLPSPAPTMLAAVHDELRSRASQWPAMTSVPDPAPLGALGPAPDGALDPFTAGVAEIGLSAQLTGSVRRLAGAERATPSMVWMTALAVLLHRLTGAPDLMIGTAVSEGPLPRSEQLLSRLERMLPVRVSVPPGATWREILRSVRESDLDTRGHAAAAAAQPVFAQPQSSRSPGAHPLFQVVMTSPDRLDPPRVIGRTRFSAREAITNRTRYELEAQLTDDSGRTTGHLKYREASLTSDAASAMARRLESAIHEMATHPDSVIGAWDLLTDAERDLLTRVWNRPASPYPRDVAVHQLFEARADMDPSAPALCFDDIHCTYQELDQQANRLAHRLRSAGVRPEDRIGILLGHCGKWVIGALAVLKVGAAYVPLDPAYPPDRLSYMATDARLAAIISDTFHAMSAPRGTERILLDAETAVIDALPAERLSLPVSPRQLAYVMYTSGSTGRPKGAGVEHRNIVRLVRGTDYVTFDRDTVMGQASSVSFDAATFEIWGALLGGGRLVGIPRDDLLSPDRLAARIRENQINTLLLTTSLAHQVAHERPESVAGLHYLVVGGEQADRRALNRLMSSGLRHLVNAYGPTECATITSTYPCDALKGSDEPVPIGFPIGNTRVYVLDRHLQLLPPGVPGELYVGGDAVGRGYPGRAGQTAERFVPNPFGGPGERLYRTGDRAVHRADGALVFLGRVDRQLKIRGLRIEPAEVESALRSCGEIDEAVLETRLHPDGQPRLVGYVVPSPGGDIQKALEHLRGKLPPYLVPEVLVSMPAFPLTTNGKLDSAALPAPDFTAGLARTIREPRTATGQCVAKIWAQALGVPTVGLDTNFFALGGNSLTAMRVVSRLSEELGIHVTARLVFRNPTVSSCAAAIDALPGHSAPPRSDWTSRVAVERGTRSLADLLTQAGIAVEGLNHG